MQNGIKSSKVNKKKKTTSFKIIISSTHNSLFDKNNTEFDNIEDAKSFASFNIPRFVSYKISKTIKKEETIYEYTPDKPHWIG